MPPTKDDLHDQVDLAHKYHRPKYQDTMEAMGEIREAFLITGHTLVNNCPISRELSLALTELDNACMHAIASLARHELKGTSPNTISHPLPESQPVTEIEGTVSGFQDTASSPEEGETGFKPFSSY